MSSTSTAWLRAILLSFLAGFTGNVACDNQPVVVPGPSLETRCEHSEQCDGDRVCSPEKMCVDPCPTCGNTCDDTIDCPTGQFCAGNSTCQSECQASSDDPVCGVQRVCSVDGKCVPFNTIAPVGGEGGAGGAGDGGNGECIDLDVSFAPQIPSIVLLIDQSGSMDDQDGFGQLVDDAVDAGKYQPWDCGDESSWRWNVVRNILLHPERGVVKPLEDVVRFGMTLYSSDGGFEGNGGICPMLTEVELGFGSQESMLAEYECNDIVTDTPTRESLTVVAQKLSAADFVGPKVIVLATDGAPDTCTCANWREDAGPSCADTDDNLVVRQGVELKPSQAEQVDVMMEAQRIYEELGIRIEVIDMSSPSSGLDLHLDQVARRGGAASGASIPGFDPESLSQAFHSIIDGVRSCAVDLDGAISNGKEGTGSVMLDGEELKLNHPDGWKVNSPTQIELQGSSCETIKSGEHDIDISFPCDAFMPVPT